MTIGTYIADVRKNKNITQTELAKKIGVASPQVISNWERGFITPSLTKLKNVIRALKLDKKQVETLLVTEYRGKINRKLS